MPSRTVLHSGSNADAFKQIVGNEPDVKLASLRLSDEGMAALGEDQGVDAGDDEIVEQMACVIRGCVRGDGWPQDASVVGDDGGEALYTLP